MLDKKQFDNLVTVTQTVAQKHMEELADYVLYTGDSVIITCKGKPWAALIPYVAQKVTLDELEFEMVGKKDGICGVTFTNAVPGRK